MASQRQLAAGELEQWIGAQCVGVVLVGVAAGELEDALANEHLEAVAGAGGVFAPVGQALGEGLADAERGLGFDQPGKAAIGGKPTAVEGRLERDRSSAVAVAKE